MKLIYFELKKFTTNKKNILLFIIVSFLCAGTLYFSQYSSFFLTKASYKAEMITDNENQIKELYDLISNPDGLPKTIVESAKKEKELIEKQVVALNTDDLKNYNNLTLDRYKIIASSNSTYDKEDVENTKEYINLVKSRGLDFELQPTLQFYAFGRFVRFSIPTLFSGLFLLILSLFVSTTVSEMFENKENRIYNFFKIKKEKILFGKIAIPVFLTYIWVSLLGFANFIIFGLTDGFGSYNYPAYLINPAKIDYRSTTPDNIGIPAGKVILISLAYMLLILIFLACLGAVLSFLLKRSILVIGAIAVLIMGWSSVQMQELVQPIRKFIPMNYLNPIELLSHPDYLAGSNSLAVGIIYLLILSLSFFFISVFLFKKYRIRKIAL